MGTPKKKVDPSLKHLRYWQTVTERLKKVIELLEYYEEDTKGEFKELLLQELKEALYRAENEIREEWKKFNGFVEAVKDTVEKRIKKKKS